MHPCTTSSSLRGARRSGSPRSPLFSVLFGCAQPQRDMRRLHRLLHHRQQVVLQLVQVHFLTQRRTVSCYDLGGIIFAAVETAINKPLDALAERLEEDVNGQRGEDDGQRE